MTVYPDEQKMSLIERMLSPQNADIPQLSRETGIPKDTLYGWRRQAQRARGIAPTASASGAERWSAKEKFAMVVEAAALISAVIRRTISFSHWPPMAKPITSFQAIRIYEI